MNYQCTKCGKGYDSPVGRCTSGACGWNTVSPIIEGLSGKGAPTILSKVSRVVEDKIPTGISELDHALDGGWPKASAIVIGGEPGIGKSSCLLQAAGKFPEEIGRVLYVSAEEHASKIAMRGDRFGGVNEANITVLCEGDADRIVAVATKEKSALIILDSVQTISFPDFTPGTVASAVDLAAKFFKLAHHVGCVVVLVCHVTKDGDLAGPKKLEHFVDVVCEFDADRTTDWRVLRVLKNRSGATPRMGIFKMGPRGLECIGNPSEAMLATIDEASSGWALGVASHGGRAWVVQAQALIADCDEEEKPRLVCTGCSQKRVQQIMAVLASRCSVEVRDHLYVNVVCGLDVVDAGLDLAIAAAILSAKKDVAMLTDACMVGEIGLLGEIIRPSSHEARVELAERYGFGVMHPKKLADLVREADLAESEEAE